MERQKRTGRWARLTLLNLEEVDSALADELRLVDAHDVTGVGEDLDLAARDVPRALRSSGRASDQPVLPAEDDQGGRLDHPKLSARDGERLPGPRLALAHDPHPRTELAIHALALTQGPEDDP